MSQKQFFIYVKNLLSRQDVAVVVGGMSGDDPDSKAGARLRAMRKEVRTKISAVQELKSQKKKKKMGLINCL